MTGGLLFAPRPFSTAPALEFTVYGHPLPAGSKKAVPTEQGARVIDSTNSRAAKQWRATIAAAAVVACPDDFALLDGPLAVEFTFARPRLIGHTGSGRNHGILKAKAPAFPTTRPDVLKLARAVEDALTGVVWRDDSLIVDERIVKTWGPRESCTVRVWQLLALQVEVDAHEHHLAQLAGLLPDHERAAA